MTSATDNLATIGSNTTAYVSRASIPAAAPPPDVIGRAWTKSRITGAFLLAFWISCAALLLLYIVRTYDPDFYLRYGPRMLGGLLTTIELVVFSIVMGAILAFPIALARISSNRLLNGLSFAYVYAFRGTPLLAQTFLVYYGAGQFNETLQSLGVWWFFREAYYCVMLTFTLNTSAYQAEILRGAIQSVPKGQWEGARSLGIRDVVTFFTVVMPQALIVALRPFGNEVIFMVKGSAIASVVTVFDLMGETRLAFSRSFDFTVYLWAALIYLLIVEFLRRVWDVLEARLTRHLRRDD